MSLEPIKIPQNVYIEDRIVGPLTLRQIIICSIGGGFSYALWATIQRTYGGVSIPVTVMAWLPAVLATAVAFVRINDISLMRIFFLTLERMSKAPRRTWQPRKGIVVNIRTTPKQNKSLAEQANATPAPTTDPRLSELSSVLDHHPMESAEYAPTAVDTMTPSQEEIVKQVEPTPQQTTAPVEQIAPEQPDTTAPEIEVLKDLHPTNDTTPRVSASQPHASNSVVMRDIAPAP